jgi:hypothetical protein
VKLAFALVGAVVAAALAAPGADAHYNTARLGYRSHVLAITPRIPGVRAKILYGDDQVLLTNRTGKTIVILGYSGEPYIRFQGNEIYVNNNSPSVYLNADRYGKTPIPKFASATAKPKWLRLISGDVWAWHDHRIHWMSPIPPKPISDAPRARHHLYDWKVTATANGKRFYIKGSLDYVPPPQKKFPVNLAIALGVLVALGTAGLFGLRRVILRSME